MTGLLHELFCVNQTYDCCVCHRKCRRILRHVFKFCNNRSRNREKLTYFCDKFPCFKIANEVVVVKSLSSTKAKTQPRSQGLSGASEGGGKMRDPGNKVGKNNFLWRGDSKIVIVLKCKRKSISIAAKRAVSRKIPRKKCWVELYTILACPKWKCRAM